MSRKLYIWRLPRKICVAYADNVEDARDVVMEYKQHFSDSEIELINAEPDQIEEYNYAEIFPNF